MVTILGWKCVGPVIGKGFVWDLKYWPSVTAATPLIVTGFAKDLKFSPPEAAITSFICHEALGFALAFVFVLPFPLPFRLFGIPPPWVKSCEKTKLSPYLQSPVAHSAQTMSPEFGLLLPDFTSLYMVISAAVGTL